MKKKPPKKPECNDEHDFVEPPFRLPRLFCLGNHVFRVEEADADPRMDPRNWGLYDNSSKTLCVLKSLSGPVKREVFLHELTHAILRQAGIPLESETEERVCDTIASGILELELRNPGILTTIIAEHRREYQASYSEEPECDRG